MTYVVLRWSELGKKENDYYEKPLFFDNRADAEKAWGEWYDFLQEYPCNGEAYIAQIPEEY